MHGAIEFFTATCLNWNHLLSTDDRKEIIIDSLRFLVNDGRILVYGFVIMPNHVHFLWAKTEQWQHKNIEHSFLKYTAQKLKFYLKDNRHINELERHRSTQADREYHFWERRQWKAQMPAREVIEQKLHYIHLNPLKAGLCKKEEDYKYSSCSFYYNQNKQWEFLIHFIDALYM